MTDKKDEPTLRAPVFAIGAFNQLHLAAKQLSISLANLSESCARAGWDKRYYDKSKNRI